MAITANADAAATAYGTGTVSVSIAVAATNLIAVSVGNTVAATWCDDVDDTDDGAGNTYTVRTAIGADGDGCCFVWAYALSSVGTDATNVIVADFNNETADRKNIIASSWTIDGGDTVSMEDDAGKVSGWEGDPWETDSVLSTTGTDELAIAGFQSDSQSTEFSNPAIPIGTPATVLSVSGAGDYAFYRILTSAVTNEEAQVNVVDPTRYSCEMLAFKSTAAVGLSIPIAMHHYKQMMGVG